MAISAIIDIITYHIPAITLLYYIVDTRLLIACFCFAVYYAIAGWLLSLISHASFAAEPLHTHCYAIASLFSLIIALILLAIDTLNWLLSAIGY